jgi:competence protein ComEA
MKRAASVLIVCFLVLGVAGAPLIAQQPKPAPKTQTATAAKGELLDINSATKQQLMQIPGIGDAYSDKIIKNRPYKRKDELVAKNVIPQATYDKIKDKIVAKQK